MIDLPTPTALIDCYPIVDYRHPISQGLLGFVNPESGGTCNGAVAGTVPKIGTIEGLTYEFSNNAANYVTVAGLPKVEPPFTVLFRAKVIESGSSQRNYVSQGGAGGGKGWTISTPNSFVTTWRLTFGNVAHYSLPDLGTVTGETSWVCVAVSGNGGTARAFKDGAYKASASVGTMQTPASTYLTLGAAHNGSSYEGPMASGSTITNVFLWNRCLSDAEVKYMSIDPYACLVKKYDMHTNWAQVTATFKAWLHYYKGLRND